MAQWKQYSGMWPLQTQMQAVGNLTWPNSSQALYTWGLNSYGELGQNDLINRSYPTQVGNLTNWVQISGSPANQTALSIKINGTLWGWGNNLYGQLGQNDIVYRSSPVQIGALTNWLKVSSNSNSFVAIKTDGTIWGCGRNDFGQLGQNDVINRSSPTQIGTLTTWNEIGSCAESNFAIKTDGTLWSWGLNTDGQLGQNNVTRRSSPTQVGALTTWKKFYGGAVSSSYAIKTDGTLWSWGWNAFGELGQNNVISRSSPVQIGALTDWNNISINTSQFFIATKTNNTLWSCGANNQGQLGQNDVVYRSSPVQIGALTNWSNPAGNSYTGFAIKTDGTLWSWGYNNNGDGGVNNIVGRSSPVQIGNSNLWVNICGYNASAIALYKS